MNLYRPTYLRIRLDQLMSNFRRLQSLNPGGNFLCPMIKANAYGHGDVAVAKALEKERCQFLGVSSVEEGKVLRDNHISINVLTFGFEGKEAISELLSECLTPVVSNFNQLNELVKQVKEPTPIHLKFNTGMNRRGFSVGDLSSIMDSLFQNTNMQVQGICTHLHSGQDILMADSCSDQQIEIFQNIETWFKEPQILRHVYNSAAMAGIKKKGADYKYGSRPGLLVYGIDPEKEYSMKPLVSPVMEFKSKIVEVHKVKSGEAVSYGAMWRADKDSVIAVVPVGYADGIKRSLSNRGEVLVLGKRVPIRGAVCMDYIMIDVTELKVNKNQLLQEEVVLIGQQEEQQVTVEEMAEKAGCVSYEIITGISERVPRIYGEL